MSDTSIKDRKCQKKKVKEETIIENEQSKAVITVDLMKEMKLVKSSDTRFPYRYVRGNNDFTPLQIKDKKVQEFKIPIDMADFATLFFTENFIPAKLPIFFFDETSSLITGFLTGSKYRYGEFPLENLLKKYSKKKIEKEIPQKGIIVDEMEPLEVPEVLEETFRVFLQETETFKLYSRGSKFIDPDIEPFVFYVQSPTGAPDIYHSVIVSKEIITTNENQENKTNQKKKPEVTFFKKVYDNSSSTMTPFQHHKAISTNKVDFKSRSVSVSPSDIHESMEIMEFDEDRKTSVKVNPSPFYNFDLDGGSTSVLDSPNFQFVYNTIERILDANYYQKAQILFEHVHLNEDVDINHSLSSFITLKLPIKVSMNKVCEVTSLTWHPLNRHLLAVAYGKMHSEKTAKGIVCLWNLKNPTLPERLYKFKFSVKCIAFSAEHPYTMTVGFSNGHVAIINILAKHLVIMGDTFKLLTDCMPITHLTWFKTEYGDYYPVSSNESGEMYRYNIKRDFIPELVLSLPRQMEPVKGIKQFSKHFCRNEDKMMIPISTFSQHPKDPLHYLVGTFDGHVHICSTHYKLKALDVFAAHEGPITNIDFNPKSDNFFLTCGCDYYIKVWFYKLFLPLITFSVRKEFIYYAKWCISNPLLIIGLSDMYIDVWDLRRANDAIPVSTYENTDRISYLTFNVSPFGPNLMVGDVDGNVMLFMINETRTEPIFRIEILYSAVRNHVRNRDPRLWKRLREALPECDVETLKECADILYD